MLLNLSLTVAFKYNCMNRDLCLGGKYLACFSKIHITLLSILLLFIWLAGPVQANTLDDVRNLLMQITLILLMKRY